LKQPVRPVLKLPKMVTGLCAAVLVLDDDRWFVTVMKRTKGQDL
jgi:hypothetical protein